MTRARHTAVKIAHLAVLASAVNCHNANNTLSANGLPAISDNSQGATVSGGPSVYTIDFGQVAIGDAALTTLTLSDVGSSPLQVLSVGPPTDPEFSVELAPGTYVQSGGNVQVPCSFKPFSAGAKSAIVLVHTDSQSVPIVTLSLQGGGVLVDLRVDPKILNFGTVVVHSTLTKSITLTNQSSLDLTISEGAIEGKEPTLFNHSPLTDASTSFVLMAGSSQSISFTYQPAIPSAHDEASITLNPQIWPPVIVTLEGVASETGLLVAPNPMDFNFVQLGQISTQMLHLQNIGNQTVNITQVILANSGGGVFGFAGGTIPSALTLSEGNALDIPVQFAPIDQVLYSGNIVIVSNDNLAQIVIPLQGFGGGAAITCAPLSLDFGTVAVGIDSALPVLCTNTGTDVPDHPEAGLRIAALPTTSAAFTANLAPGTLPGYLSAGQTATVEVAYLPSGTTNDSASLTVQSNVTNLPAPPVVSLSGQGIIVGKCNYGIVPYSLNWGEVPSTDESQSQSYTQTVAIDNLGPNPCVVAGLSLSQSESNSGAFALPNGPIDSQLLAAPGQPLVVDGGALPVFLDVPVSFSPVNGVGTYTGQVSFTISDPTAPTQIVNLSAVAGDSCFSLRPNPLDFGTVGLTSGGAFCQTSQRHFVAINNCAEGVTLTDVAFGGGGAFDQIASPALPLGLAPGSLSAPFAIGFAPTSEGDFYDSVEVQTDLQGQPFGLTMHGKAIAATQHTDTFQGVATSEVDILWVIDTDDLPAELGCNGTMPCGTELLDRLSDLIGAIQPGVNYQMGIVADDCPPMDEGNIEPCSTCYNYGGAATYLTPSMPDPAGTLEGMIQKIALQPIFRDCMSYEAPMTSAWKALQPTLLSGHNAGFLRNNAALAIIVFDPDAYGLAEDEGSPDSTVFYLNYLTLLKGGDPGLVTVNLIWAHELECETNVCQPGPRYAALTSGSGGFLLDSARSDWADLNLSQLAASLSGASNITGGQVGGYVLSSTPVLNSITVWLDGPPPGPGVTTPGLQIQPQNPSGVWNWQYNSASNSIVINIQNIVLGPNDTIAVVYSLACG